MSSSFVGSLSSIWLLFRESQVSHPSSAAVKLTSLSYQYWFLCVPTCCIFAINMFAFCTLALSAWGCKFFKSLGENLCLNHSCFSSTPAIALQYSCLENSMDRGAGGLQSMGSQRVRHDWVTNTLPCRGPQCTIVQCPVGIPHCPVLPFEDSSWLYACVPHFQYFETLCFPIP